MADDYQVYEIDWSEAQFIALKNAVDELGAEMMFHVVRPDGAHIFGTVGGHEPDFAAHTYIGTEQMWQSFRDKFMEGTDGDMEPE